MEEFYNNPFNNKEVDDICFAPVFSLGTEFSSNEPQSLTDTSAALSVRRSAREYDAYGSPAAVRLQQQLNETMRANDAACTTYKNHIETQRQEIDRLDECNNGLQMKIARLESEMRAVLLEKDCAAMAYKREVEKNAALEGRVVALERELHSMEQRARELAATYSRGSVPLTAGRGQEKQSQEFEQERPQPTHQPMISQLPTSQRLPLSYSSVQHSQREGVVHSGPRTGDSASNVRVNAGAYPGHCGDEDALKNVKDLERRLQLACQRKDSVEAQLNKLENLRSRTGAERAKKIALERELSSLQGEIGTYRMRLRSLSALIR
ncbi:hypothetical protein ERJ75_000723100 [Trypanosoma vivax]|uniref:Uncharacterized protein n=1 Tax=Trypanosoma vivax (strain Y486) TaxID=1055687 RepID=G0TWX7_TRYVY|nr:hypothetical protein TRVL_03062 [Trypanosoma vivax]KAH8614027.1 hypothetical protein ERJ75_000723100 [Trypanosoma vivax]CCC48465.1 conserved hypothetical protein [Trypanosoma vivax Y486]